MFSWAFIFFVIGMITTIVGLFDLADGATDVANVFYLVALVMAIISFAMGRPPPDVRADVHRPW